MKEIRLETGGLSAAVNDEDFELLSQYKWWPIQGKGTVYAYTVQILLDGKRINCLMHRAILKQSSAKVLVDHKDGNGLNNQRLNIRAATYSQNNANKLYGVRGKKTSRFKGVCWKKRNGNWTAQIKIDKKYKHLGVFSCEEDAARAYDQAAVVIFGEFARTNFGQEGRKDERITA